MTTTIDAFHRLSFVNHPKRGKANNRASFWHLPPPPDNYVEAQRVNSDGSVNDVGTALYGIGCKQGQSAAIEFLDMVHDHPEVGPGRLQYIVLGMLEADRGDHLRGQVVGFFSTLEAHLKGAAP